LESEVKLEEIGQPPKFMIKNIYLLKDLAKISGYSTHALKFYLRLGLLKEIGRSPATNFRYFDDSSNERLKLIRELQKNDYSLKEIQEQLDQRTQSEEHT
jgi:DNA-binding transcriptional MerR regulator